MMKKDKHGVVEKILDFTLEILYLLTGEYYMVVKKPGNNITPIRSLHVSRGSSRTNSSSMGSPLPSLVCEGNLEKKILELTHQIICLLTGEVPIRCEDVTVHLSMEEWEYMEEHRDIYKEVLMGNHQPDLSLDSYFRRTPPDEFLSSAVLTDKGSEDERVCSRNKSQKSRSRSLGTTYEEGNVTDMRALNDHSQAEGTSTYVKVEPGSRVEENPADFYIYPPSDRTQTEYPTTSVKEEPAPSEEETPVPVDIFPPTQHTRTECSHIKEKVAFCGEETLKHDHSYTVKEHIFTRSMYGKDHIHTSDVIRPERIRTVEQPFSCFTCGNFSSLMYLSHTGERIYKCTECSPRTEGDLRNSDFNAITKHMETFYPSTPTRGESSSCEGGNRTSSIFDSPTKHPTTLFKGDPHSCEEGETIDGVYPTLEGVGVWINPDDEVTKTEIRPIAVMKGTAFDGKLNRVPVYQQTTHINKVYTCSECQKCFTDTFEYAKHRRVHTKEKPFSCSQCGKCFSHKSSFVKHQWIHIGKKLFSCPECDKSFVCSSYLAKHQKIHNGEKPFACSACGRSFRRSSQLVMHQRTHTGEKPFSCSVCGKSFAVKSNLATHQRIHSGIKPYSCPKCGKCFNCKASLVIHLDIHSEKKLYSCTDCGKCFAQRSTLFRHKNIHSERKSFPCSVCGRGFTQKSSLNLHQRIHTGEKPFACAECGKCFTNRPDLLKHETIHTGKNPFPCSECGVCFNHKSSLTKHQKIHTGEKGLF